MQSHFSIAVAFGLNRKALGIDLLKAPVNLFWTVPYAGSSLSAAFELLHGSQGVAH
jgi:hypothetical protein